MKHFYIVYTAQLDGKSYAGVDTLTNNENIMNLSGRMYGMTSATLCSSKKEAQQLADLWNAAYKHNGTSVFD